jgi:hypothetical protein
VPGGTGWCELVPAGESRYRLVESSEIGIEGYNPCSSVQDRNIRADKR